MKVDYFLEKMNELGIRFYTGVPDSQLKPLCDVLHTKCTLGENHIIAANEGAAVGIAAGHYLATGNLALVYMQNSGIGNAMNPIISLTNEKVYDIPVVYMVGWRGKPGTHDEPQHIFQGEITIQLLELIGIKCFIVTKEMDLDEIDIIMQQVKNRIKTRQSVAFIVEKGGLDADVVSDYQNENQFCRESAIQTIVENTCEKDIFVSTTGKISRELFEIREKLGQGHEKDFLMVGSMGHASMIALGIAQQKKKETIWCLDGDGSSLMHMGNMAICAGTGCNNMTHVVLNNYAHETVGGMPVGYGGLAFSEIGQALGYETSVSVKDETELRMAMEQFQKVRGTKLLEIKVSLQSRQDLGRPTSTTIENKQAFMKYLKGSGMDGGEA